MSRLGPLLTLASIALWALAWSLSELPPTVDMAVNFLGLILKFLLLFACVPLTLASLAPTLHQNARAARAFAVRGSLATALAIVAYLPFRTAFCRLTRSVAVKAYYAELPRDFDGGLPRFAEWQRAFATGRIHALELALLVAFYGTLAIALWRIHSPVRAAITATVLGYLLLVVAPVAFGLVIWDYDTFLLGLVFDSISIDLWLPGLWSNAIFLDLFLLLLFATAASTLRAHRT